MGRGSGLLVGSLFMVAGYLACTIPACVPSTPSGAQSVGYSPTSQVLTSSDIGGFCPWAISDPIVAFNNHALDPALTQFNGSGEAHRTGPGNQYINVTVSHGIVVGKFGGRRFSIREASNEVRLRKLRHPTDRTDGARRLLGGCIPPRH